MTREQLELLVAFLSGFILGPALHDALKFVVKRW